MLRDMNRWFEEHRWAGDALIAAPLLVVLGATSVGTTVLTGGPYHQWNYVTNYSSVVMTVALVLPLFLRRSYPLLVLLTTIAFTLMQAVFIQDPVPGDAVVPIVVHAAAAYIPDRRWRYTALIAGLVGSVVAAVQWSGFPFDHEPSLLMTIFLASVAVVGVGYLLGIRQRDRREHAAEQLAAMAERNRLLTAERDSRVEASAAGERARIARELHDIVAHSLSVIVVQADGGAAAARLKPEIGPEVLETIAETSRDALAQMRRMVSVLRAGDGSLPAEFAPAAGPDNVPELVDQVRDTGLPVTLETIGGPRPMSPDAGLAVYRVVQESLTNVLKHAGPAASVQVILHYGPREAVVTVTDDGRGAASAFAIAEPPPGGNSEYDAALEPGHGLQGMRERVELLGGSVHAGPRVGGGYEVAVTIPYGTTAAAPAPAMPTAAVPSASAPTMPTAPVPAAPTPAATPAAPVPADTVSTEPAGAESAASAPDTAAPGVEEPAGPAGTAPTRAPVFPPWPPDTTDTAG